MTLATCTRLNFDSEFFKKHTTLDYYLSRGASGSVFGPITWHDERLAIKQVMFADGTVTEEVKEDLQVKKDTWTSLEHRHLMKIVSVDLTRLPMVMFIVMEFAAGGSLKKTLRLVGAENKLQNKLPIDIVTDWGKQIAEGMLYMHQKNIVHRDLKSSNILLTTPFDFRNPQTKVTLKITDFDDFKEHDHTTTLSFKGTCAYMAPEFLKGQRFSKYSDVWSYGVVIWEMLSGDIPHKQLDPTTIIRKSQAGELDNLPLDYSFPEDYKRVLERCWKSTRSERQSFAEIVCVLQRMEKATVVKTSSITDEGESTPLNEPTENERQSGIYEEISRYPMNSRPRGLCLIINNANFDKGLSHLTSRRGAERDAELIKKLFEDLHFSVTVHSDVNAQLMEAICLTMHIADHTNYDAFVCCILTHGKLGVIYTSDGKPVEILQIVDYFTDKNCPTLKGKPRMFFIQACQRGYPDPEYRTVDNGLTHDGSREDHSSSQNTTSDSVSEAENREMVEEGVSINQKGISEMIVTEYEKVIDEDAISAPTVSIYDESLPTTFKHKAVFVPGFPDFLMSYSTLPGSISYRDRETGSFYIQALCDCLRTGMEIDRALKMVSSNVKEAMRQRGELDGGPERFQLPFHLTSGMDRLIYL